MDEKTTTKEQFEADAAICTLELPLAPLPKDAYRPRHLELIMKPEEAIVMKRLFLGLDQMGARLSNGRRVATYADAIRFVLQSMNPS